MEVYIRSLFSIRLLDTVDERNGSYNSSASSTGRWQNEKKVDDATSTSAFHS